MRMTGASIANVVQETTRPKNATEHCFQKRRHDIRCPFSPSSNGAHLQQWRSMRTILTTEDLGTSPTLHSAPLKSGFALSTGTTPPQISELPKFLYSRTKLTQIGES